MRPPTSDANSSATDATLANSPSVTAEGAFTQSGSESSSFSAIVPGNMLGPYKIIEKIGEGGMGLVFKATDTTLERTVAVKVMYCEAHEDQKRAQRFVREARSMARLSHPNLLHVYSVGSQGACHYFAMEILRGETLAHAIRRIGRIPAPDMMHYAVQIIAALFYVHRNGIIHRDIKSGNIILCGRRAVLMDFGLAKDADDSGLTTAGAIMGTPDYMPPEAAEGRTEGPPTDIYSLGVVLYEALSGRLPFMGKSAISIIRQHIDTAPPPLQTLVPEIKPELAAVVHRCMAKKSVDRFADCPALAAALWDLLPEQGLLDVAEGRLSDAESTLEQTHFGNFGSGKNVAMSPTLTGVQDRAITATETLEGRAEDVLSNVGAEPAAKRIPQWVWAIMGFAGVFILLIFLFVISKPAAKSFKGQPVLSKTPRTSERDLLIEFKGNDSDPKNWYFVFRRKQSDGSTQDLKIPYSNYVPKSEDFELHFLTDEKQQNP